MRLSEVRICCFEEDHARILGAIQGELTRNFYRPEWGSEEDLRDLTFMAPWRDGVNEF